MDIASISNIGRDLTALFVCRAFKPLITKPTKSANKINDHIWSKCPYNFNSGEISNGITDHCYFYMLQIVK